ncbi:major facilitator superfamily permease [Streptococcus suis]|nr:major facilitator superfamily permease [Streptococcus suis]
MVAVPIWRSFLILLSFSSFFLVFYEDSQYKPFGFRYWLGLVAYLAQFGDFGILFYRLYWWFNYGL